MLNKSIPYYNIIMKCDNINRFEIKLPEGYTFKEYQTGFENDWAALEFQIGDFSSFEEAKQYFIENYISHKDELIKRGVFLLDKNKKVVGSCIAWTDIRNNKEVGSLHWLIVSPKHQGKGLGKALCQKTLQIFKSINETTVYIHTQPWSWKAIVLYTSLGFKLLKNDSFSHYENQYKCAMSALKEVVNEELYQHLLDFSV